MAGLGYEIEVALKTVGSFAHLDGMFSRFDKLNRGMDTFTSKATRGFNEMTKPIMGLASSFESIASRAATVAITAGVVGIGTAAAAASYGVASLNANLESTTISLGTIYSAKGAALGIADGIAMAKDNIALMRKEAALLPGEFEDLKTIVTTTATPLLGAGMDPVEQIKLSSKIMAAGVVSQMPLDQVAREASLLVEGRSGGQNTFGVKLLGLQGDKAEAFNKMPVAERIATLNTELDKYSGSIEIFGKSWEGISSTFVDNVKQFGGLATAPLFNVLKGQLSDVNAWFDENRGTINVWAGYIGDQLANAWEWGSKKAMEWGPIAYNFAVEVKTQLVDAYTQIQPLLSTVEMVAKHAFGSEAKTTIGLLITAGQVWAGVKVAGMGLDVLKGGLAMTGGAKKMYGAWSDGGGLSAVLGGTFGASKDGRHRDEKGRFLSGPAPAAGAVVEATVSSFARFAPYLLPAAGALAVLGTAGWALYEAEMRLQESATGAADALMSQFTAMDGTIKDTSAAWTAVAAEQEKTLDKIKPLGAVLEQQTILTHNSADGFTALVTSLWSAHEALVRFARLDEKFTDINRQETREATNKERLDYFQNGNSHQRGLEMGRFALESAMMNIGEKRDDKATGKDKTPKHHGTTIQKVEIVVTSNQDPGRIARATVEQLVKVSRGHTSSPHVRNLSAGRML